MGAFEMLGLGQHVPGEMKAGVGLIPAVNLDYFRDNDVAGARANINNAYGLAAGSTSATVPLPADANPFVPVNAAQITSPVRLYGSSGDATAPWADAVTMAGRMPNCTATDVSAGGGHTDATIAAAPVAEIVDFVLAHA
jgi:pimeloyl-ACP methyl ester carboxylesterase